MAAIRAGLVWRQGQRPADLATNCGTYESRLIAAIRDLAGFFAARIEAWARRHAAWTDRTGNARSGLTATALPLAAGAVIVLFHTVQYGIFLELANAGRYAVVLAALAAHYPDLMTALRRLVA